MPKKSSTADLEPRIKRKYVRRQPIPAPIPEIDYKARYEQLVARVKASTGAGRAQDYLRNLRDSVK